MANRSTYTNKITGSGTLNAYCTTEKGSTWYATRTPIQCNFSEFEGTLKPSSSVDDPAVLRFTLDTSNGMPKGTMYIASGVEVQNSGRTFRIGKLTGSGALGGSCTFSNGASVGVNTWQVGNDQSWTTTVKVTSNANLVKIGTGKITWQGVNSNTGTTTINEGELAVYSSGSLGTGRLTVGANGTLSGSNTTSNALKNSTIVVNGTVHPGSTKIATTGTIYFGNNPVTFNAGSQLNVGARACATSTNSGCTTLEGISTLTMNGKIYVYLSSSHSLVAGDSIRLWKATTMSGTPIVESEDESIAWDDSRISEGLLIVKSIATGLNYTTRPAMKKNDIFDLRGRLVRKNATDTNGLPTGIYIQNGKKVIVR
jgi:hypothetical protein